MDLIFFIDIFMNFRTSYISTSSGEEVVDPKLIALKYLKGRFIVDLLSTIPFDNLAPNSDVLPMFGMLKLARVLRVKMVIRNLNIKNSSKSLLKVIWLVFGLFLYIHVIACLWYYIVRDTEGWVINYDFVLGGTLYPHEVYTGSFLRKYLRMFYVSFYIISIGEMAPRTNVEIFISSVIMVGSAILISHIFGSMAVLAVELNAKSIKFQE